MGVNLPIPNVNSPFKFWCQKALPLVYDDSLSYYEVLCKLTKYVNGLRDGVILLGKDVSELNNLYNELKALVEKYYEHGVQSSVDKKLDEMAENGYFEDIIARYIKDDFPLFFETTTEMIETNLSVGTKVRTQGFYKSCDGGACDFIISNTETPYSIKLNNGNYANVCTVNSVITPEIFGAKGDGVTDDSVALQKALDCCFKNETHNIFRGTRYKNYGTTTPIDIDMKDVPNSDGIIDFNGAKITAISNNLKYLLSYNTSGNVNGTYVHHSKTTLTNVTLECNSEKAHTGLYIPYSAGTIFSNINIYGCRRGILLAGGYESSIKNCFVRRNKENDIVAMLDPNNDGLQDIGIVDPLKDVFPEKKREETLIDSKIDLIKTQCVGFELRVTDSFIDSCIAVDCVIGFRITGGDNKITGCHPWNASCDRQLKSSCCVLTSGNNFFENLTCDRFYIGVYHLYNLPSFFSNTLFTNQPLPTFNGDFATYCWYINPDYAIRSMGSTIYANNTRVKGNLNTTGLKLNLNWCNLKYPAIHDINTQGTNILNYLPFIDSIGCETGITDNVNNIECNTYGKIESIDSEIKMDTNCNTELFTTGITEAGHYNNTIFGANCSFETKNNNGEIWFEMLKAKNPDKSAYLFLGCTEQGKKFTLLKNHKYLISLKYKTTNSNMQLFTSKAKDVIYPSVKLIADGDTHLWWNMFTYDHDFQCIIGVTDGNNANNLSFCNLRVYDITNVPRYYFENTGAYFTRITNFIGGNMGTITVPKREDVSFISTQLPIEFGKNEKTPTNLANYDPLANFYTVRYTSKGKPMIWSHKNTIVNPPEPNLYFENCFDVTFNKSMFAYFGTVISDYQNNFSFIIDSTTEGITTPLYTMTGNPNDGSFTINRFEGEKYRVKLRNKINTNDEPAILLSFTANYDNECDSPIIDNGGVIPIYKGGGIYVILKGSGENEDYMRELPTICYKITY